MSLHEPDAADLLREERILFDMIFTLSAGLTPAAPMAFDDMVRAELSLIASALRESLGQSETDHHRRSGF